MRGVKRTTPLFITCKREGCEGIREVRRPGEQRKGGYCSQRCNALDHNNILHANHHESGVSSGRARQRRLLARLDGLTPRQIFRLGYVRGLQSKYRQLAKGYVLVKRESAKGRAA